MIPFRLSGYDFHIGNLASCQNHWMILVTKSCTLNLHYIRHQVSITKAYHQLHMWVVLVGQDPKVWLILPLLKPVSFSKALLSNLVVRNPDRPSMICSSVKPTCRGSVLGLSVCSPATNLITKILLPYHPRHPYCTTFWIVVWPVQTLELRCQPTHGYLGSFHSYHSHRPSVSQSECSIEHLKI
jgi:hypothetical protein